MAWTFCTRNGGLYRNGKPVAAGYSGHAEGRNNPDLEWQPRVGPIPEGRWRIVGPPRDTASHGPFVLRLEPMAGTVTFGRGGFLIHGDSVVQPGTASLGCIILPHHVREDIWGSQDFDLEVVHQPPSPLGVA